MRCSMRLSVVTTGNVTDTYLPLLLKYNADLQQRSKPAETPAKDLSKK